MTRTTTLAWSLVVAALALLAAATSGRVSGNPTIEPWGWTVTLIFALLGVRFSTHSPHNPVGWLMLAVALSAALSVLAASRSDIPWIAWLGAVLWLPAYTLIPVLALLFPTGRPVTPRWWSAVALVGLGTVLIAVGLAFAAWDSPTTFWADAVEGQVERDWSVAAVAIGLALVALSMVLGVVSLILRWLQQPDLRPMLGWAIACATLTVVAGALEAAVVPSIWSLTALALPAAATVAVLRYGLFDITMIIHRTLLYALLTVTLLGLYAVCVWAVARFVPEQSDAVAAVSVALAVSPLLSLLHQSISRWLFGDRSDPYRALSGLGVRLQGSLAVDEVLPAIAEHVAMALKAPYVRASVVTQSPRGTVEIGRSRGWPVLSFPMTFRGSQVGEIAVENRAPDERYHGREVRLLAALASGAGPAAHALVLTEDLRLARERIVLAREEERRRLRRDLHDGVGAGLAGAVMQIRTAGRRLSNVDRAAPLLETATRDLVNLTAEVRRVVDGLRPPSLDHGLGPALHEVAAAYAGTELRVELTVGNQVRDLPAAVEVAAYHITLEALANAARHASASRCLVGATADSRGLRLEITDDGTGLSGNGSAPGSREGLGLTSMRERASELGGRLDVQPAVPAGTRIVAWLPIDAGRLAP